MRNLNNFIKKYTPLIEKNLKKNLPEGNFVLYRAMRYSVFSGGKRIRPLLMLASYLATGGEKISEVLEFASAIEMIHTYSLIHDDLPAMDNDNYRRGKLTCHRKFTESIAILAGDALLTMGLKIAGKNYEVLKVLSESIGENGMIKGQVLDILYENLKSKNSRTKKILNDIHINKTAKFISACCEIGVILSGNKKLRKNLKNFGLNIGMAFQIQDDILDKEEKRLSFPNLYSLESSKNKVKFYTDKALKEIENIDGTGILKSFALTLSKRKK